MKLTLKTLVEKLPFAEKVLYQTRIEQMTPQHAFENITTLHVITLVLLSLLLLWLIDQKRKRSRKNNLPPGPKPLPLIGNLHQLGRLPDLTQKYGSLMYLKLGSIPTILISSSEVAMELFKNHDRDFLDRPLFYAGSILTYGCSNLTFAPYGDYWRELRKIMILELLSQKRVQLFQKVRSEEVKIMVDSISQHSSSPVDLSKATILMVNNVVCRVAFGKLYESYRVDELLNDVQKVIAELNIADFFPMLWWINKFNGKNKQIYMVLKRTDDLFDKVSKDHQLDDLNHMRDIDHHEDLVDVLLRIKSDSNHTIALTNDQIKGIFMDIFVAGTDTSSATITWAMTELMRNPIVMKRVQEEVREAVKDKGKVEEGDLSSLVYLKAVIKETFRLCSPVPFLIPRKSNEACTFYGYNIPANTKVLIDSKAIMNDPKCWERANEFLPERFLNNEIDYKGQHFDYLPFGAGRRGCPGLNFGVATVELGLANLLYGFDWKLPDGTGIEDVDMEPTVGITVHKKIPLCLVATPYKGA